MAKSIVRKKTGASVKNISNKKSSKNRFVFVKKTDTLGDVINNYPEIAPVLASAGLHCIGCHVSVYESIEQGCLAHGMSVSDVDDLVDAANKRINAYENMPQVAFTANALTELIKRKGKSKFIKIAQIFGGEFDFEASDSKEKHVVQIDACFGSKAVIVLAEKRIERMLRGVKIDYDSKKKDFVAIKE